MIMQLKPCDRRFGPTYVCDHWHWEPRWECDLLNSGWSEGWAGSSRAIGSVEGLLAWGGGVPERRLSVWEWESILGEGKIGKAAIFCPI